MFKRIAALLLAVITLTAVLALTTPASAEMTDEEKIWFYFKDKGLTDAGAAGLMGNLFAESGLKPNNLQNSYESKLGHTDISYTAAVDSGTYTSEQFINDKAGYGLAQWTYWSRKQGLYNFAKSRGVSIADLSMQLDYLSREMVQSFNSTVWQVLLSTTDVRTASNAVLLEFEQPADQSTPVQNLRYSYSMTYYNKYAGKEKPQESSEESSEISVEESSEEIIPILYGDANGDGRVNAMDASTVLQYDIKLITEIDAAANVNTDEEINAQDAALILQYDIKLIQKFPCEE